MERVYSQRKEHGAGRNMEVRRRKRRERMVCRELSGVCHHPRPSIRWEDGWQLVDGQQAVQGLTAAGSHYPCWSGLFASIGTPHILVNNSKELTASPSWTWMEYFFLIIKKLTIK